tara:strand:- start:841 stop:1092 length:252 start_codon:yes stop_codon:yes gene_type:complete
LKTAINLYTVPLFQRIDWLIRKKNKEGKDIFVISLESFLELGDEERSVLGRRYWGVDHFDNNYTLKKVPYIVGNAKTYFFKKR